MNFEQICIYILNVFMIIIGFYLFFLYVKSKEFHTYSCYNLIIMSLILTIDNIIRLIPTKSMPTFFHYLQAFLLVFFDKMILSILSMQIIVIYIGIIMTNIYFQREKKIFIIGTIICVGVSAALTTLFIAIPQDISKDEESELYYYCDYSWSGKPILDSIFNGILLCINFFCTVVVLAYYSKKKKAAEEGIIEDLGYKRQYIRFIILFFINILIIVESYLIIFDVISNYIDLIYLSSCLLIDLCYSFNHTVYKVTLKIFCKKKFEDEKTPDILIKKNTFDEECQEDEDDDDD